MLIRTANPSQRAWQEYFRLTLAGTILTSHPVCPEQDRRTFIEGRAKLHPFSFDPTHLERCCRGKSSYVQPTLGLR